LIASGREYLLKPDENTVGREGTDVLLEDATVSRRHALIVLEDGKCFVEDLGSTNGTSVNRAQVSNGERVEAASGAELKFGSSILALDLPEMIAEPAEEAVEETPEVEAAEPVEQMEEAAEAVESPEQEVVEEPAAEEPKISPVAHLISPETSEEFAIMPGVNTIGRRGDNDIVLAGDPYVSGSHAQITAEDGVFTLLDVGSTNGTMLNGAKVEPDEPVTISSGDEIVFGKTAVRFQPAE